VHRRYPATLASRPFWIYSALVGAMTHHQSAADQSSLAADARLIG
jgi:hypothetical protein